MKPTVLTNAKRINDKIFRVGYMCEYKQTKFSPWICLEFSYFNIQCWRIIFKMRTAKMSAHLSVGLPCINLIKSYLVLIQRCIKKNNNLFLRLFLLIHPKVGHGWSYTLCAVYLLQQCLLKQYFWQFKILKIYPLPTTTTKCGWIPLINKDYTVLFLVMGVYDGII